MASWQRVVEILRGRSSSAGAASAAGPSPRVRAFVAWTLKHGRLLWLVALVLAVPATLRTATMYTHLRTEAEELLPRDAPSVLAINELRQRIPGLLFLGIVVDTGTAANLPAGERLIDDLAARIRAYPPELAARVRVGDAEESAFLEKNAPLFVDLADLRTIRARIEARRDYEVEKELGTLLDESEPPPSIDVADIEKKYDDQLGSAVGHDEADPRAPGRSARFPHHRFSNEALHLTMALVEVGEYSTGQGRSAELLGRVKADLAALGGPAGYAPGMRVGYAGDVPIFVEETSALMSDLSVSSVLVMVAVIGAIFFYYRWWRSLFILMPPLLLAAVYAFGLASLWPFHITELNSNTAFLGSIIIGNGINFGIILLARYVEERRALVPVEEALARAVHGARPGTVAAALAAAASYASLGITQFRGFRQFGAIGGMGMVLAWVLAFVLMPPLAAMIDRSDATAPRKRAAGGSPMAPLSRLIARWPTPITIVALLFTAGAVAEVSTFRVDTAIERDLSKLRSADTWKTGEGYWGERMDAVLGHNLTPMAFLTDSPAEARALVDRLEIARKQPAMGDRIDSVRTLEEVLPRDQPPKLAELAAIRHDMTPRLRAQVPASQRAALNRLLDPDLRVLGAEDLPSSFTSGLRERDGSIGRTVLVYPKPDHVLWQGPALVRMVTALRRVGADVPRGERPARLAGSHELTADISIALSRDGPRATGLAFLGVAAVVVLIFGRSTTCLVVLLSLLTGVLWLAGIELFFGVKLNFANFIAYPITFGIGVDYPVNVMSRYVQEGSRDISRAVRSTGGAVVLCSATTIIGYSSLLLAQNRALFLFGLLAVIGEITCLTIAVLAMPAAVTWWRARHLPKPAGLARAEQPAEMGP